MRRSGIVEVVDQVHFDFRNGRADRRRADFETPEHALARVVHRERTTEYPFNDIDVCPSAVQRTLKIDLSALDKGH